MVALRKDVKVGLTIGAIAVLVIGVYAGLSALAGEKPANPGTAQLDVTPSASKPAGSGTSVATKTAPTDAQKNALALIGAAPVAGTPTNPAAPTTPTETNPTDPLVAKANSEDPWSVAFGSGTLTPKKTVTPTPGKTDAAADRADTIKSLNGDTKTATANAGDGSGSMSGGTTPPVLTRASGSTPTGPAIAAGPGKTHTVEAGDTFSSISNQFYGDSKYYNLIITANPSVNPNKLKPGTVLQIPALAKPEPKSDTAETPTVGGGTTTAKAAIDATKQYVVKPGDSLHKICATLWNDTAQSSKLYDLNKSVIGADPTKLKPGMVLALPTPPTEKVKS